MIEPTIADLDLIRSALSDQPGSLAEFEKHLGNDRDALGYALAANIGPIRLSAIEGPHPESPEWHAGYEAGRAESELRATPVRELLDAVEALLTSEPKSYWLRAQPIARLRNAYNDLIWVTLREKS